MLSIQVATVAEGHHDTQVALLGVATVAALEALLQLGKHCAIKTEKVRNMPGIDGK